MSSANFELLRVLHVAPTFHPATRWGGPIFSTKALCDGLARCSGVRLRVLTTDAAGPDSTDRLRPKCNPTLFEAGYEVRYTRRLAGASISPELLARLPEAMRWADVVHLTATYSFPTTPVLALARILGKPVVWSPRGALQATQQWSGAPRKRIKRCFERICQSLRPEATVLHVTAALEAELSCARLSGIETAQIPNIIDVPDMLPAREWRPNGKLRIMFISRLHPKKGIEDLLASMSKLPRHVTLDIYGAGERVYEASLRGEAEARKLGERVRFHGHVNEEGKRFAFSNADVMCLPTYSENFGIVVGEALAHGVPVVTTTGAPWEGLEREECGLWVQPGEAALLKALARLDASDLATMGERGREWMRREFSERGVRNAMLQVYRGLVSSDKSKGDT